MNSPESVAMSFANAWNNADADALTAVFKNDADFVNVVGFWWHGHRQIRHNHAIGFRDMFPDTEMVFEKTKTRMLSNDQVAVVHARWKMTGQITPDQQQRGGTRRGVLTFVCEKQADDSWLAVSAHNTDIIDGMQTHLASEDGITPVHYTR
ncbi:hypothetical protein N24_0266 [Corynebacterium suranareeae]|uniref:SnoaL-like domain-containing protein n=1 Tax=Corynebacterium suranareeae TaxID=2506452 RepID=A0A169RN72_9CORY|nr:hypothetical protein N24_0266 [Corynebacterium suranareeae]